METVVSAESYVQRNILVMEKPVKMVLLVTKKLMDSIIVLILNSQTVPKLMEYVVRYITGNHSQILHCVTVCVEQEQ